MPRPGTWSNVTLGRVGVPKEGWGGEEADVQPFPLF